MSERLWKSLVALFGCGLAIGLTIGVLAILNRLFQL